MDDYEGKYKEYLISKKLSLNTINSYIYDINNFEVYIKYNYECKLYNAKKAQILTYLVDLQKSGKSSSTISRTISSLKSFFDFLKKERIVNDNVAMSIHSPKQIKKVPNILTEVEISELMNIPDTKIFKGARDSAILELMYSSGIKVTELINIKVNDINFNLGIIYIKGSKQRIVPLANTAAIAVNHYINNFRNTKSEEEELFINTSGEPISRQGIWKILKYYGKKLNLQKELSPQILRNSFAVHLLKNGADLMTVQELMGHTSLAATQIYLENIEYKSLEVFKKTFPRQ